MAQWWVYQTRDLVFVSLIPSWGKLSFRCIFASHLCTCTCPLWKSCSIFNPTYIRLNIEQRFSLRSSASAPLLKHKRRVVGDFGKKVVLAPRKHMCVTDNHDMTLAVKLVSNSNTTNQVLSLAGWEKPYYDYLTLNEKIVDVTKLKAYLQMTNWMLLKWWFLLLVTSIFSFSHSVFQSLLL